MPSNPTKRAKDFAAIEEYKERFRHESSERLRERAAAAPLMKLAAIALREVLAEREDADASDPKDSN